MRAPEEEDRQGNGPDVGQLAIRCDPLDDAFNRAEGGCLVLLAFEITFAERVKHAVRKSGCR